MVWRDSNFAAMVAGAGTRFREGNMVMLREYSEFHYVFADEARQINGSSSFNGTWFPSMRTPAIVSLKEQNWGKAKTKLNY